MIICCLSVGIRTRLRAGRLEFYGSISGGAWKFFSSPPRPERLWGSPSLISNGYQGALSLGVKRLGREADHSPPSSAEVKEWVEIHLHSLNTPSWCGAWKKEHSDNSTVLMWPEGENRPQRYIATRILRSDQRSSLNTSVGERSQGNYQCFSHIANRILGYMVTTRPFACKNSDPGHGHVQGHFWLLISPKLATPRKSKSQRSTHRTWRHVQVFLTLVSYLLLRIFNGASSSYTLSNDIWLWVSLDGCRGK
jgi:hypothetical protein